MVEAEIGHDAVHPGIERAFKPKIGQIHVSSQKGLLVDVLRVFLRSSGMHGQPQYRPVIKPYQFLERGGITLLGSADQPEVVDTRRFAGR